MPEDQSKKRFYPLKPKTEDGFKKAVAWLGGRELVSSLKGTLIYAIYGENMDPRSWMKANVYPNVEEKVKFLIEDDLAAEANLISERKSSEYVQLLETIELKAEEKINEEKEIQDRIERQVNYFWRSKTRESLNWKQDSYRFWEDYLKDRISDDAEPGEFWFDYIADSGDGQMGVFGVACMCLSDLWLPGDRVGSEVRFEPPSGKDEIEKHSLLPRGSFLFVGGDTAYHSANYATIFERFQSPFRWAFTSVRKFAAKTYRLKRTEHEKYFLVETEPQHVFQDNSTEPVENWDGTIADVIDGKLYWDTEPLRPIFGVPANHDYYDGIDGFNKQFRKAPFEEILENMVYDDEKSRIFLQIPTFSREQEASYTALRLPFGWWMFGIDSENEKLDFRQEIFYKNLMKRKPRKLILATPEPTTVFGKKSTEKDKTTTYLKAITDSLGLEQPFLADGKFSPIDSSKVNSGENYCRLDLSGDVHHYARYWGENTRKFEDGEFSSQNYASLVAGGGGAFFDPTETLIGKTLNSKKERIKTDGFGKKVHGEIPPQMLYPSERASVNRTAEILFDLWNIKKGGYVQTAGAVVSIIIFFFLTRFSNASEFFSHPQEIASNLFNRTAMSGLILVAVAILLGFSSYSLNSLITRLKEKKFKNEIDETIDGRVFQLKVPFFFFIAAVASYVFFLMIRGLLYWVAETKYVTDPFAESIFLLIHFVIAVLLIWLSMDFTNWLPVRFKLTRTYKEKTLSQKIEDPNEESDSWYLKLLGKLSREYSYKYIPSNVLVICAIAVLILGIRLFGNGDLAKIFADLTLTLVIVGGFVVITYLLAVNTGAAYQKTDGKIRFFFIGVWQFILQLSTPFILYYYASPIVVAFILILVILVNGVSKSSYRIQTYFADTGSNARLKQKLIKLTNFRLAALLMKKGDRKLLTIAWLIYGLIVLGTPFLFSAIFPRSDSLSRIVFSISAWITGNELLEITDWIYLAISILIVGYCGYRMSRVWFTWYLAVSLAFNGHNNEAGGAARIEGFKHILRIKVEEEKLTVYVIGFDEAQPELEELKLKLVDKFELLSAPLPQPKTTANDAT